LHEDRSKRNPETNSVAYFFPDFSEDRFSLRDLPLRFQCTSLLYLFPLEEVGHSSLVSAGTAAEIISKVNQGILWNTYCFTSFHCRLDIDREEDTCH